MNWFNHQTIGWITHIMSPENWCDQHFCQIFSGLSVMMWSSNRHSKWDYILTTEHRPTWIFGSRSHLHQAVWNEKWVELELLPNSKWIQTSEVFLKDPTRKWAFQHVSTPMPEAFQRCFIGWFDYFNSFHQLDHLHGMDMDGYPAMVWLIGGNQNLCFYTASHNIAACNYMFVDFYYWKMLLLKWS